MLLQESRRAARSSAEGELILQDQQDRLLWNRDLIAEGIALTESALRSRRFGAYTLQAAIAAVHADPFGGHARTGAKSRCSTTG
jgi:RNA polymerase sigma-70 factor, ECF subfamily